MPISTIDPKRNLALLLNEQSKHKFHQGQLKVALQLSKQAVQTLKDIPEKHLTSNDWHQLAKYHYDTALCEENDQKKFDWYENIFTSLDHVPEKDFTSYNWLQLSIYYYGMGNLCKEDPQQNLTWLENAITIFKHVPINEFTQQHWQHLVLCHRENQELKLRHFSSNNASSSHLTLFNHPSSQSRAEQQDIKHIAEIRF